MAKKTNPARAHRYKAEAKLPPVQLGNLGGKYSIRLDITREDKLLGAFEVSRAGLEWKRAQKQSGIRMTWYTLAELIETRNSN